MYLLPVSYTHLVKESGIRFGLEKLQNTLNFNAWQAGLERMTLGYAMREEQGVWQDVYKRQHKGF